MKKSFAVFGLGRFGGTIVKEFHNMGIEVIAIDKDEVKVNEYMNYATQTFCANAIDETTLIQLGIRNVDHAFVSFGRDIESSILITLLLKEIGVKKVWAKAQNEYHSKALKKIGVDKVIHPERDVARRIARHIVSDKMIDFIELSKDYSIVEIVVKKKLIYKSLGELNVRAKFGCTIVGIQRQGTFIVSPTAEEVINKEDVLIIIGHNSDIARFEEGV
ncbi:potassium channel family protein [Lysinibacillus fusiformis]|uniref:potassium channel family protein n=1 Tax=Lysinibacillus fusiformis TaxID=28031 RepID=UPI000D34481E|nr:MULTISPECIES: TrkA family potassium uptake protein [Lysinibacillus]MED4669727.1 TrkA family potassium uptake protein [Lysinibacillus fusiformis]QAS55772.1 potassium transporter Trk [Lysinibacillus sphaericus]GED66102.1 ktr system potassium uptake protein A [Lysinibacillus fusiformis]